MKVGREFIKLQKRHVYEVVWFRRCCWVELRCEFFALRIILRGKVLVSGGERGVMLYIYEKYHSEKLFFDSMRSRGF